MVEKKLPNLFQLINGMRYYGAGSKVTRSIYKFPDTYWIVKQVKLSKDQEHGKAYGRLIWRGRPQPFDREIHSARKSQWILVSTPNYATFKGQPQNYEALVNEANDWFSKFGVWVNPPKEEIKAES